MNTLLKNTTIGPLSAKVASNVHEVYVRVGGVAQW